MIGPEQHASEPLTEAAGNAVNAAARPPGPPTEGTDPDVDLYRSADSTELREGRASLLLAVAAGGAVGAVARHAIQRRWPSPVDGFPWAVLVVNVAGSVAIGVLLVLVVEVMPARTGCCAPSWGPESWVDSPP